MRGSKGLIAIMVTIVAIVILVVAVPVPYTTTETVNESVPYEVQESYNEPTSSVIENCSQTAFNTVAQYSNDYSSAIWPESICIPDGDRSSDIDKCKLSNESWLSYTVHNYEKQEGHFIVRIYYEDATHKIIENSSFMYKGFSLGASGSTGSIIDFRDVLKFQPVNQTSVYFVAVLEKPNMTMCVNQTVINLVAKNRSVTRFRQESKEKDVNKYAPLITQWFG